MSEFVLTGQINLRPPQNLDAIKQQIQNKFSNLALVPLNQIPVVNSQVKKLNSELTRTVVLSKDVDEAFFSIGNNLGKTVRRFGAFTVATTALFGIIRSFQANIKEAVLFEKELLKISQVTGTSVKGLDNLKDTITDLSTSLGIGSTKLLSVARIMAQAGLAAEDVKITMSAIAKSDLAPTFENMEATTEGVVAVMRQFKKEAQDVEGVLGSMNAVAGKFAVESGDLIQFIRGAGGTFEAAGGTVDQLLALGTSIRATTRESAASIATGMRTIFARLQRTRTQNFLEDFNIQLKLTREEAEKLGRTEGEFIGPFEAIERLSIALKQIPSTDPRFAQIIEELGGFRQINKVIPLIKQNTLAQQAYNVSLQGTNSLNKDAEKALGSLANKIDRLAEKFVEISRVLLENEGVKSLINQMILLSDTTLKTLKALTDFSSILQILPAFSIAGAASFVSGFKGIKRNRGGRVPGEGNTDTVPAMLTPGEFVIRKEAVASIGLAKLMKMNATGKIQGFNAGGIVSGFSAALQNPSTINQIQIGGALYALSSVLGENVSSFKELSENVSMAATTFIALSLGTSFFRKDFSKATEEATTNIKALTENLNNLKTTEGRTSVLDSKGKQHFVMNQVASHISGLTAGGDTSLDSKLDKVSVLVDQAKQIEQNARNLKNESIKSSREDAAGVKRVSAFRNESGTVFKGEDVKNLQTKIEKELSESFFGIDVKGILNNSGTRTQLNSILNNTADFQNILSSNTNKGNDGTILAQFLKNEIGPDFDLSKFLDPNSKVQDKKYAEKFYAATGYKGVKKDIGVRGILESFSKGDISGRQVQDIFSGTEFAGAFREFVRSVGTDKARVLTGRAIREEQNIPLDKLVDSLSKKTISETITPGSTTKEIDDLFKNLSLYSREEQERIIKLIAKSQELAKLQQGSVTVDKNGRVISSAEAKEIKDSEFLNQGSDLSRYMSKEEKLLIEKAKKQQKIVQYLSTEEGAKKEIANIERQRKVIQERILQRTNILRSLEPNAKNDAYRAKLDAENAKDINTVAGLNRRKETVTSIRSREMAIQENSIENQTKKQNELIKSEEAKILQNQRLERATNYASITLNAFGSGLLAYGAYLEKEANTRLEAFRKGVGGSENIARDTGIARGSTLGATGMIGLGLMGAQAGAGFGAKGGFVGLLAGSVIGLVGGALYGFYTGAKEADEAIQSIVRNRTLDKFENALISVADKGFSVNSSSSAIRGGATSALNDVFTLQGDSNREDLFGRLESMRNPLQEFVTKVSTSVSSLSEFNQIVGEDTIRLFLILNNIPLSKFNEDIQKNIVLSQKSRTINTNLIKANQDLLYRMITQRTLVASVNESVLSLDKNLGNLDSIVSGIEGNFKSNLSLAGVERLGKTGEIVNFKAFQNDVTKIGNIFGDAGRLVSENSIKAAQAINVLPNILLDVNSRSSLEGVGEFAQKMEDQLEKAGIGKEISDILVAQVAGIIGPEAKDQNIIEKLKTDFDGTVAEITKGLSILSDPLKEAGAMFQTKFNQIGDLLDQRANIESKVNASFLKTLDVYEQGERIIASAFGRDVDLQKILGLDRKRQYSILPVPNLQNNPEGIFERLQSVQDSLRESQNKLQNSTSLTAQEMLDLREKISNQKQEVGSLTGALEFMADVTQRTSVLQEMLNKEQKDRQTKFGFAETLAFGGNQEIRQLFGSIQLTNQAIVSGSLENFSDEQKKQIQSLLDRVGDTALFKDGLTGTKVKEMLVGNMIDRVGGDKRGIIAAGDKEKQLQNSILNAVLLSQQAQQALYQNLQGQNLQFNKALETTLDSFISDLGTTFNTSAIIKLENEIANKQSVANESKKKIDTVKEFEDTFGANIATVQNVAGALSNFNKQESTFNQVKSRKKLFGEDGLGISSLGDIETKKYVKNIIPGTSGGKGVVLGDMIDTNQSKVVLKNLEATLSSQIADKQLVTNIISDVSKNIIPNSIINKGGKDFIDIGKLLSGVDKTVETMQKALEENLLLAKADKEEALGLLSNDPKRIDELTKLIAGIDFAKLAKDLGENFDLSVTQNQLDILNKEISNLSDTISKLQNAGKPFSSGGLVGGAGNRDSISARLTPGEFVLNRKTVEKVGISNLNRLNQSNSRTSVSQSSTGITATNNNLEIAQESLGQLNRAMQTFAFNVQKLEKAFSSFPTEITITGRHYVEVVINGAQVLQNIKPEIAALIETEVKGSINKMLKVKFPDKGQML